MKNRFVQGRSYDFSILKSINFSHFIFKYINMFFHFTERGDGRLTRKALKSLLIYAILIDIS